MLFGGEKIKAKNSSDIVKAEISHSQGGFYLLGKKLRNLKSSWPFAAEDRRFALGMAWPSLQTTIHVPVSNLS